MLMLADLLPSRVLPKIGALLKRKLIEFLISRCDIFLPSSSSSSAIASAIARYGYLEKKRRENLMRKFFADSFMFTYHLQTGLAAPRWLQTRGFC